MSKHHLVISGTGRAGTTFLVQLLTELGLDTGFPDPSSGVYANCNAGMEWDISHPDAPYIVKSPVLCEFLDDVLRDGRTVIDHVVVPMRDLYAAAESRRDVTRRADLALWGAAVPGGLWHTDQPEHQEAALAIQFHKLIETVAKHDVPITLLHFPRFIHDPQYLYEKLKNGTGIISGIEFESFCPAFRRVARPDLIHEFRPGRGDA
jgi:hypothetical protein